MNVSNSKRFKQMLVEQGKNFEKTINSMKKNDSAEQDRDEPTELSNYDNHPAEMGTQLFQLELNQALRVHEEHLLKEVHDALQRIEQGKYGQCQLCGQGIAEERLEAIPYARLCKQCEDDKTIDPEILAKQRPNEELVIDAPMGRKYLNERDDDEYEGLDYLNDLMKYGSSDTPQDMGGYHEYEEFYTNEIDKQGIVDSVDQISNQDYIRQLPDE